ncbi:ATP-binding cassette domain-containing protein [Rhizobium alvei]|uniref:ATP-binding cassette domain-containing protein n=1 Tax=Rhizobium alvei TaxID=1132659 RepID=A0ABT8YSG3_9HYPH|nr:ATP-binding cassette domain-containing protein [Rhizobium alvei]MDO6966703.1 ATP-binding cassette domain-containing protein [Rhizobium alvei]
MNDGPTIFSTTDLRFDIGGRALVRDVSLAFPARSVSALIGHNGSGKSTLLKMLARQIIPTAGSIRFADEPISRFGSRDFARRVAYLPQDLHAAQDMTVRELVALGRYPWHGALGRFTEEDRSKVEEAIELTHLEPFANRAVGTLSGGERQRAWIAMLVAQDSQCLLLDEPTSALDLAHQIEVLSLIRTLSHDKGLSVILVLHDINMAARFSDRIFALKAGSVIAEGCPDDLLDKTVLESIYGIAMDVTRQPGSTRPLAYVC